MCLSIGHLCPRVVSRVRALSKRVQRDELANANGFVIGNSAVSEDKSLHNCNTASHTCSTLRTKNSKRKTAYKADQALRKPGIPAWNTPFPWYATATRIRTMLAA